MKRFKASLVLAAGVLVSVSAMASDLVVSKAERENIMKGAVVWENPGNISSMDMLQGPGKKFDLNQDVTCKFYDGLYTKLAGTGYTEKFWCAEEGKNPLKDNFKVKYNTTNGEVFAEVVSSRLLWSLGFFADKAYPISVNCENCPDDPWSYLHHVASYKRLENSSSEARDDHANYILRAQERRTQRNDESMRTTGMPYRKRYDVALSEGKFDGKAITQEGADKPGFGLDELGKLSPEFGGSSKAQTDALALLLAFIKHGDSKPENHRLTCPEANIIAKADGSQSCSHAKLVLQDIGATMGNGSVKIIAFRFIMSSSKMDFKAWRDTPVWDDVSVCRARLKDSSHGTLRNPTVSEAGRKFLADLMAQLTDKQITDMFTAARADQRRGVDSAGISEWVQLFKSKRAEILNARCPQ